MVSGKLSRCAGRDLAKFRFRRTSRQGFGSDECEITAGTVLAKSKSQEKQIRSGLEALRRAGVAVDDPSPFLVQRLRDHFGKDPQMDLAVVFTLGRIAEAAAVEALEKIENDARDK